MDGACTLYTVNKKCVKYFKLHAKRASERQKAEEGR